MDTYTVKQVTNMSSEQLRLLAREYLPKDQHYVAKRSKLIDFILKNLDEDDRLDPTDSEWYEKPYIGQIYVVEHGDIDKTEKHLTIDSVPGVSIVGRQEM